jgi:hypothetical protein
MGHVWRDLKFDITTCRKNALYFETCPSDFKQKNKFYEDLGRRMEYLKEIDRRLKVSYDAKLNFYKASWGLPEGQKLVTSNS